MIKFFRRIRQQLLGENRFPKPTSMAGRYLLYAIGEIVLVVLGILIALQINTWNENVKLNKLEQEALVNLKQDFAFNRSELLKIIGTNDRYMESCIETLNHTGDKFSMDFEIDLILSDITASQAYFPKNGFLNDLINSGNLGIIKNNQLRNRLSSWLPSLKNIEERQNLSAEFENDMVRFISKNGSWLNSDEVTSNDVISQIKFPKSGFQINNNDILKLPEFENIVENRVVHLYVLKNRCQESLSLIEEILDLLNSEIEK